MGLSRSGDPKERLSAVCWDSEGCIKKRAGSSVGLQEVPLHTPEMKKKMPLTACGQCLQPADYLQQIVATNHRQCAASDGCRAPNTQKRPFFCKVVKHPHMHCPWRAGGAGLHDANRTTNGVRPWPVCQPDTSDAFLGRGFWMLPCGVVCSAVFLSGGASGAATPPCTFGQILHEIPLPPPFGGGWTVAFGQSIAVRGPW